MTPVWQRVSGQSMSPALRDGDEVLLAPVGDAPLAAGEVVVARWDGRIVIHRVVAVHGGQVVTRGDACRRDDRPVVTGRILFRAVRRRRASRVEPIPARAAAPLRVLRRLRSLLARSLASRAGAPGRWWRARRSCSTSRGGGSWA